MDFDALTGGVEPGGLRVKNDIRLLICYLLSSINAPLSKQDIVQIMQENSLANYFEVMDSLSEMIQKGTIDTVSFNQLNEKEDCVICNDITRNIAKQLDSTLPISVRDCAVSAAFKLYYISPARCLSTTFFCPSSFQVEKHKSCLLYIHCYQMCFEVLS